MQISPDVRRPLVLASVMAAFFMVAIEATIVSTAMPQIVAHLGHLELYAWVFSAFLLAQTATTVVFGKLADLFGRKAVILVGIAIFLAGSLLCGFAWSMPSLIAFRLVQGIGAGAVQPVAQTVVGDLYAAHERGRIQGYLASVWGISSVVGPLVGGLIIQHVSWAWIFWINLPVGLIAALGFHLFLRESVSRERRPVDVLGALLFTTAIAALMLALTEAGRADPSTSLWAALVFVIAGTLFVWQERRAADPMLQFGLWARRLIATINATVLLSGMTLIGLTTFLPMYVQAVLGHSALVAGFTLTMTVLGWPIAATVAARNFARFGLRPTLVLGGILLPVGAVPFVLLAPGVSPVVAGIGSLIVGFGMGLLSTTAIVIIQDSVGWAERGSATAANMFARNLGSKLGATVLGAVLNISLAGSGKVSAEQVRHLLDRGAQAAGEAGVREALGAALHITFWGVLAIALVTMLATLLVPAVRLHQRQDRPA